MSDIKTLVKTLSLPSGGETSANSYSWNKRGGYAGESAVRRVESAASAAGWKSTDDSSDSPDGSTARGSTVYVSPEGHKLTVTSSYGGSKGDNSFSIRLTLAGLGEGRRMKLSASQLRKIIIETVKSRKLREAKELDVLMVEEQVEDLVGAMVEAFSDPEDDSMNLDNLHTEFSNVILAAVEECMSMVSVGSSDVSPALPAPHPRSGMKGQW